MPIIENYDYKPPILFRNGHFNTIFPALFRKQEKINFQRQRISTPDDDFLDIDVLIKKGNTKAVFLFHGLEGSTDSQYIKGAAKELHALGYDIIATNFRGCSGTPNLKLITYHSGFTDDIAFVLNKFSAGYLSTSIVSYSLGGNASLKYAGENPAAVHPKLEKIIAVSVPVHLSDGSKQIHKKSNYFYAQNFLKTLHEKAVEKNNRFPGSFDWGRLRKVNTIWDFDEHFTAPVNGFNNAEDYYAKSMSLQFLLNIEIDCHLISSLDDPFLAKSCFPFAEAKASKHIFLHTTKYGGHVGFYQNGGPYWLESKIVDILNNF